MISIKSTPKLNGITIQGDFDDLNNLYEAISDYTTFYIDGILNEIEAEYVKEHGVAIKDMTVEQRDTFFQLNQSEITYFEELRENILGLCYDIRHAFQGDRGVVLAENGCDLLYECEEDLPSKNLQFSVEVLYPWAFYYLFALRDMLDNMYKPEWLNGIGEYGVSRNELDIQLYRSIIDTFIALMWKNLDELFSKDFETLYNYFIQKDCSDLLDRSYLTGICNYLVADHCDRLSKTKYQSFKKKILLILAYDSMDADNIHDKFYSKEPYVVASKKQYQKAIEYVNKVATHPYITNNAFMSELLKTALKGNGELSEDWVTDLFGEADWDNLEW